MRENQNGNRKHEKQLGIGQAKADAFMMMVDTFTCVRVRLSARELIIIPPIHSGMNIE